MKKRAKKTLIVLTMIVPLLIVPVSVNVNAFLLPSVYDKTYLGELKEKVYRLKDSEGKRIVLIGGSALPFGIDSSLIEEELPSYKVVNFGMYASLGSDVMLDFAKARINSGDLLFFCPEQNVQTLSLYYDGEALLEALDGDFSLMNLLPASTKERLIGDLYAFSQKKLSYTLGKEMDLSGIYQKSSFNEYGDIDHELTPYCVLPDYFDPTTPIPFDIFPTDEFIEKANSFASYAREKGASVYFYPAPMNQLAIKDSDETVKSYYSKLEKRLDMGFPFNPFDSILDGEYFYDTNFHLNKAGARNYTKKMIQMIKLILNDPSPTNIDDAEKPSRPEIEKPVADNNEDLSYFTYRPKEDGTYAVSSLVKTKDSFIVPASHNGKYITSVDSEVFQNQTGIEEITFQDSISYIEDHSFKNCSSLRKIHLKHRKPSSIRVGTELLDGTEADLYVSQDVLSSFVLDYTFSRYAERIKGE